MWIRWIRIRNTGRNVKKTSFKKVKGKSQYQRERSDLDPHECDEIRNTKFMYQNSQSRACDESPSLPIMSVVSR
jgi:hypothetical protein